MLERKAESAISQDLYALRQKFNQLFPHAWDFIVKETLESAWKTVRKYKLTEQKLWYKYTDPEKVLGVRFGVETKHGLYDIDLGSIYDPREHEQSLKSLKAQLETWGITSFVLLQSSFSQGLHLYFFLDRPINTFRLACVMNKAAVDAGVEIKRGQLETFPNTKRYNSLFNGHRLPLQQGSYLLDKDYVPYSDRLGDFLDAAEWSAERNDTELLESRLNEAYEWFKAKKNQSRIYSPTPEDQDFIEQVDYAQREIKEGFLNQIRISIEQGFTGTHETNELLLTIAKLGRILYGLSGQQYIDYIKETVMSCPGYLKYCRHKHEIDRRCMEVARYGEKHWYPYRTSLPQNRSNYKYISQSLTNQTNLNRERQHNAQSRIIQAVATIQQGQGKLPHKVGECKLAIRNITKELFGISVSDATLNKPENITLWHPKYRQVEKEPNPENITQESNNPPETSLTFEALPLEKSSNAIQKTLHLEPPNSSQYKQRATFLHVIRKNDPNPKLLKPLSSNSFKTSCYTLPIMKGVLPHLSIQVLYQIFQRAYCEAVIKNQDVVFLFSGFKGKSIGGLVKRRGQQQTKLESIPPNSEVIVQINQLHSTYFRDYPEQILVYLKPLVDAEDWHQGIPVSLELLLPLRIKKKKESNLVYDHDN